MRMQIYNFLVNRHSGIRERYHRYHDVGGRKLLSYCYLLGMNIQYYIFRKKELDLPEAAQIFEEKELCCDISESALANRNRMDINSYIDKLSKYNIISFDIFDTLIFRPFSEPTDLFYFLGSELGIMDFKRIRIEQEWRARQARFKEKGHYEVTLAEIWNRIEREVGISAEQGMQLEQDLEMKFCYANPFMLEVFKRLQELEKKIIVVSDMYMPKEFLSELLKKNGYTGISKLYVSCESGCNKGTGKLFLEVVKDFSEKSIIHVGDNENSDGRMAEKIGITSSIYFNINNLATSYRSYDMSPVIGGAYRGIVDNHIYQGLKSYSMEFEYGFIYGGFFVVGYCNFIHSYCQKNHVDKLLFLSRDGDTLKQVYDKLYPQDKTSYVFWSRSASAKLMAEYDRHDYFRRFLYHKVNQHKRIREILTSMDLVDFADRIDKEDEWTAGRVRIKSSDLLTDKNVNILKEYLIENFAEVLICYREQMEAAEAYYHKELDGCRHAAAVDIGWAGSGALSLSYLVERVWNLPCEITGIIAGTNTLHNAEPDASEIFLQSGKLVSYLFSQSHNRDIMKKHDPNKDYNVYWELLLSSPTRQFLGFGFEDRADENGEQIIKLCFGKEDANQDGIRQIQNGILDFAEEYQVHFKDFPYMFQISGRDAYAPMLLASSHKERYLKEIAKRFSLEINVI